jgi:succinyl-CoA synthetase beta subunit
MNFEDQAAKPLLAAAGIAVPPGRPCRTAEEVAEAVRNIGPAVVKAQVPTGKRGKAGGIAAVDTPEQARAEAERILKLDIGGHPVQGLLVEARVDIARELYAAVLNDPDSRGPLILLSAAGGMDIEEIAGQHPEQLLRLAVDIRRGPDPADLAVLVERLGGVPEPQLVELLQRLYGVYTDDDAELVEINPLALTRDGGLLALDCKFVLDDSAIGRRPELAARGTPDRLTELEARGRDLGLKYLELDGNVGILANGAGLTMTSMDAVSHYGGQPANFLEIGGEAYTRGRDALALVLANPRVKSLLVNFCGAFARTDVMVEGLLAAWDAVPDDLPVFFTVHGTGEDEAVAMLRERLGAEPFDLMDDAVRAAVEAAR